MLMTAESDSRNFFGQNIIISISSDSYIVEKNTTMK